MAEIDRAIRTLRGITLTSVCSLVLFVVVATMFRKEIAPEATGDLQNALFGVLAFLAAGSAAAYAVVCRQTRAGLKNRAMELRSAAEPLGIVLGGYRLMVVLRAGLIEGPGFLAVVIHVLTGSQLALAVAGLSVVLLLATAPSRAELQRLADDVRQC
jgi:hypothetical protein